MSIFGNKENSDYSLSPRGEWYDVKIIQDDRGFYVALRTTGRKRLGPMGALRVNGIFTELFTLWKGTASPGELLYRAYGTARRRRRSGRETEEEAGASVQGCEK